MINFIGSQCRKNLIMYYWKMASRAIRKTLQKLSLYKKIHHTTIYTHLFNCVGLPNNCVPNTLSLLTVGQRGLQRQTSQWVNKKKPGCNVYIRQLVNKCCALLQLPNSHQSTSKFVNLLSNFELNWYRIAGAAPIATGKITPLKHAYHLWDIDCPLGEKP